MPRTDPPRKKRPSTRSKAPSSRAAGSPTTDGKAGARQAEGPAEEDEQIDITIGETDIILGEADMTVGDAEITVAEGELEGSDFPVWESVDPHPSPHDRVTLVPPLPEREYVAEMMKNASDRVPPSRAVTPHRGVDMTGALRSAPAHAKEPSGPSPPRRVDTPGPLTLDLSESIAPPPVPTFDESGVRERNTLPSVGTASAPPYEAARFSFGPASGDALEIVGVRAESVKPGAEPAATMREVQHRFDVGDFTGALAIAAQILEKDPESVDALLYAEHCRDVLKQMYISNLGGLRRVPQVAVSAEQLRWLSLDHRAGFLLSLMDGRSTFDEVLDVCGMPPFDAIRLLVQLLQQNVIRVL